MPRSAKSLPSYRKHSSGQARVTINGRDYLLGPWNTKVSHHEYDRLIAEYLSSGRCSSFGLEPGGYTVAMLVRDYIAHSRLYYGEDLSSDLHRIKPALKPLIHLYRDSLATDFGPQCFKAVRETMLQSGLTRQGINRRMKLVCRAFKWAASEGKIPAAIYETLRLVPSLKLGRTTAREAKKIKPIDDSVVDATIPHMPPIVADMVQFQRITGCRPSEVCNLTPASLDRSDDIWVATLTEHKTAHHGHTRKLFIGPRVQTIISTYLERETDEALFQPCETMAMRRRKDSESRITPLSCGNRPGKRSGGLKGTHARKKAGDRYTTNSYRRAIHYACDKAFPAPAPLGKRSGESDAARRKRLNQQQLEELQKWQSEHRWSPNRLRHTRGTEVRKTHGIEAAQVLLGHSNADVTQVYAERDETLAKHVARETG